MRVGKRSRRPAAAIVGDQRARQAAVALGREVRSSRSRRRLTQQALAAKVGISRQRIGDIEAGRSLSIPAQVWFAVAEALGRYLRFEFARDTLQELADAGHLAIQELVLRVARAAGWEGRFEAPSRSWESGRSVDAELIDRRGRRLVIGECWNTFGDLGAATRSSDRKLNEAEMKAVALAGDGPPFEVGLCWIVRDTKANRAIVARYEHIFASRFPGSSAHWVAALTKGDPMPDQPGLIWCDTRCTRLFARRRPRPGPAR